VEEEEVDGVEKSSSSPMLVSMSCNVVRLGPNRKASGNQKR
jgi:hypothetical protein